ncbi:MAG: hypothetical protein SFY80_01620 [Verrucomicrobiota bacterium]|nr:hypothetical protein [Verrucomicrobiota bacterium]
MSNHNFENPSEGDWEDRGELSWNEFDWKHFLERHEAEISRFSELYEVHRSDINHLDTIAHLMEWDSNDWASSEDSMEDDEEDDDDDDSADLDETDPYTLHRHPVYIVTRALFGHLRQLWERYWDNNHPHVPSRLIWDYATQLTHSEINMILGVHALDMGDYALCVTQLKIALASYNKLFTTLNQIGDQQSVPGASFLEDSRFRLFDLRELCLRLMADCREEMKHPGRDLD